MIETFNHPTDRPTKNTDYTEQEKRTMCQPRHLNGPLEEAPASTGRQKRHSSNPYNSAGSHGVKRRGANHATWDTPAQYLDHGTAPNTPSKELAFSRKPSATRRTINRTPRSTVSYVADTPASPFCCSPNGSSSRLGHLSRVANNSGQNLSGSRMSIPQVFTESLFASNQGEPTACPQGPRTISDGHDTGMISVNNSDANEQSFDGRDVSRNDEGPDKTKRNDSINNNGNNDNDNNKDNNEDNSGSVPSVAVPTRKSSQAIVQKLQDIYKVIVKQEIELQERCSQLTNSQTTELKQLWVIYKVNSDLINNYVTFITTALLPPQSDQDLAVGQEIVEIYRIERRLWVYGTITFLDVLKNFSNFMDPEVCAQFITHVFISISNMLADIPARYAIPWYQRLGDLSRMAIALYPSGFIDWKLSAEHWYREAMKYTYGHGKLYYHMSTVQQNTLEAFVNLGKSVFCQDTFTPSQQYMQLVIDNIYQRAFVERNNGNHRNSQLIEYLKHSEVMLLPSFLESADLQQVVLIYFRDKFGMDANENNIFATKQMFDQNPDQLKYFFRHAPAFAESHILQLVGFGDPKNPFALLFELPKCLKDRRDKKEKRKVKSSPTTETSSAMAIDEDDLSDTSFSGEAQVQKFFDNIDSLVSSHLFPPSMEIWNQSLKYLNITSLNCSMVVLKKFLEGPMVVALPHLLPWTYFIIAVVGKVENITDDGSREFWIELVNRILPWNTIVNFLNVLIAYALENLHPSLPLDLLCQEFSEKDLYQLIEHFNNNEDLPEVWKCWGVLWFDAICNKDEAQINSYESVGIKDHMFLDSPIDGIGFDGDDESGVKFWKRVCRVIFLFKGVAQTFKTRLVVSSQAQVHCNRTDVPTNHVLRSFCFKLRDTFEDSNHDLSILQKTIEVFEESSVTNRSMEAVPQLSVVEGESIFDYFGYKRLLFDFSCYDRGGEFTSTSLYTSWGNETPQFTNKEDTEPEVGQSQPVATEADLFNESMQSSLAEFKIDSPTCQMNSTDTFFVLDATSWLRHFAHVYKLASNKVLKFAICLTTFQELRFLRKSKDENVVEAATRAVITVRQLYSENRILPLRFTGNVATHIEEHLEFEEQITWRSHVDEFVFEAIKKAHARLSQIEPEDNDFNYAVLVTDDTSMRRKAQQHAIRTLSTRFVFATCSAVGDRLQVCTN